MRIQSNGKVRRTSAEWEAIFAEFESSGLSAAAFCRRKKLAKGTFSKRRRTRRRRPATRRPKPARFVELAPARVLPAAPPRAEVPDHTFELELPGGVVLRWKS